MQVILSGKKSKLFDTVAAALAGSRGLRVNAVPPGSDLLAAARESGRGALVFVLRSEGELEPLRWALQQNRRLPTIAVLPRPDSGLGWLLRQEGVEEVVPASGLDPAQLRASLRKGITAVAAPGGRAASDLHAARSALTAILSNAEMALHNMPPGSAAAKQLHEIVHGVEEIERILRRLERGFRLDSPQPR